MLGEVVQNIISTLIIITLFSLSSCSKQDAAIISGEAVKNSAGDGNQTAGGDGGNNGNNGNNGEDDGGEDGGGNQTAGGNGGNNGGNGNIPTKTPTPTPSGNNGGTATVTPTSTATTSNTLTATPTSTATTSNTLTATPTSTATITTTSTATQTATATATYTSSGTVTATATHTSTSTPTASATGTAIGTQTGTSTSTPTATPSHHCTGTHTHTPTPSPSTTTTGILGCTLNIAVNYNPSATVDNGSCQFKACLDNNFSEYSGDNIVQVIQNYATQYHLNVNQIHQSTCKTFVTKSTTNFCCGCYNPVVTKGLACPGNCSQKFINNPHCYWSYISCDQNRILQAYHSNGSLKFTTYQPVPYCTSRGTKGALFQYKFGTNYEAALHVKKLARPIAYAPAKLYPNDPRLKGKTYISFKNTIGVMVNADFTIKEFVHGKGNDFTPSASCTATYEVRGHYKLNTSTGLLELQTPGENITTVDQEKILVSPAFTQSPFWIKLKKQGDTVDCSYQAATTYPTSWSILSASPQIVKGWDGQTVLNAIIGPKFQAGIILNAHSLEGIEVYEYKQLNP